MVVINSAVTATVSILHCPADALPRNRSINRGLLLRRGALSLLLPLHEPPGLPGPTGARRPGRGPGLGGLVPTERPESEE